MAYTHWRLGTENGAASTKTVRGRTYSIAAGSYVDVPEFDAELLVSQGWVRLARDVVATANRPAGAVKGTAVFDSTLGATVVSDGKGNWLHHGTGALA